MQIDWIATVTALIAVYIAYQQYRVNRYKIKLDLYERRFKFFEAVHEYIRQVSLKNLGHETFSNFYTSTNEAKLFFDSDVIDYLIELNYNAIMLRDYYLDYEQNFANEKNEKIKELLNWFEYQHRDAQNVFLPYLCFSKLK
jgi:hypothetical protein